MVDLLLQQKYDLLGKKVEKWHDHGFAKNPLNNGLRRKIQLLCAANLQMPVKYFGSISKYLD